MVDHVAARWPVFIIIALLNVSASFITPHDETSHDDGSHQRFVRSAEYLHGGFEAQVCRPQVEDQHLVLAVMHVRFQFAAQFRQFASVQFTQEDGELYVIARTVQCLKDLVSPAIVADIIADEVVSSGHGYLVTMLV